MIITIIVLRLIGKGILKKIYIYSVFYSKRAIGKVENLNFSSGPQNTKYIQNSELPELTQGKNYLLTGLTRERDWEY